jgi:GH35 family endo-1,4-beta-xylanase
MTKKKLSDAIKKILLLFALFFCALFSNRNLYAQFPSPAALDSIRKLSEADHQQMMAQINVTSLRPGPSGNPSAPNAANIDESKAAPYTSIPDPLVMNDGKKVTSAKMWWDKRRPEIVEDFDREIYGRVPANVPVVTWEVLNVFDDYVGGVAAISKRIVGHVDNSSYPQIKVDIQLTLTTPANATGPVPVMIEFGFQFPPNFRPPGPPANAGPTWQEQVLKKGWGYAILVPTSVQADNGAGLTQGIIGLVNKGQSRKPDDWGALRAWAWGASRALDYFETDKSVDAKQVGIEGLSRYGKAAVVTMAYEPRFAIGFIGSSGAGGTKILRRVFGEQVENLASSAEYHWFCGNFIKYAGPKTPNDLPVDAHELVALCAPRPVFISSGSPTVEGRWVDAKGMFEGGAFAGPVYRLLGKKDFGTTEFPPQETSLLNGEVAWRQHSGGHTTGPNWPFFLDYASRYIQSKSKIEIKPIANIKGLKDYYKDYFSIGVAVSLRSLKTDEAQLIVQQFNSITPENAMKMGPIHPAENEYNFRDADSIVAFAKRNGIKIRGHNLCWHNQTPRWFFTDTAGKLVSKEVLLQRLKDHITTVVSRYKGSIYAWDVVNEVISDKSDEYFRNSMFYQICGEDFVAKAFEYAHEADPDAILFYNDYNEISASKRAKIIKMVKGLQEKGVPIGGVGLQGHWAVNEPSKEQLDSTLRDFASLGLKLQITELDISTYPKEHNARERKPEDANTSFTKEKEDRQAEVYKYCFELFRKYKNIITGVTFWNISDRSSWLDNFPVRGRKDYPLLFDKDLKPKNAFWGVVKF